MQTDIICKQATVYLYHNLTVCCCRQNCNCGLLLLQLNFSFKCNQHFPIALVFNLFSSLSGPGIRLFTNKPIRNVPTLIETKLCNYIYCCALRWENNRCSPSRFPALIFLSFKFISSPCCWQLIPILYILCSTFVNCDSHFLRPCYRLCQFHFCGWEQSVI